jgi:hypothetical protein
METISEVLDPFNLLGIRESEGDKRQKELVEAQKKYARLWRYAESKGIPMKLLGYPKRVLQLEAAGLGGSGKVPGPTNVEFLPPIVPDTQPHATSDDIKEVEEKTEEMKHDVIEAVGPLGKAELLARGFVTEEDFVKPRSGSSGGGSSSSAPRSGSSSSSSAPRSGGASRSGGAKKPIKVVNDVYNPFSPTSNKGKKYKRENNNVTNHTRVVAIVESLASNKNSLLRTTTKKDAESVKKLIRDILKQKPEVSLKILGVLNRAGVSVAGRKVPDIQKSITNRSGAETVLIMNEISDILRGEAHRSGRSQSDIDTFEVVETGNVAVARVGAETTPIHEIPNIHESIRDILTSNGVHTVVASRFAVSLINRMRGLTSVFIDKFGGRDIGVDKAHTLMAQYMEEIEDSLIDDAKVSKVSAHNIKKTILSLIFNTKEAFGELTCNIKLKDKYQVFKDVLKDVKTPAKEPKLPAFRTPREGEEAVGGLLQSGIDSGLPPLQRGIDYVTAQEFRHGDDLDFDLDDFDLSDLSESETEMDDNLLEDLPFPAVGQERDPSGLPSGNVILTNAAAIARVLRGWGEGNTIFRTGGYRGSIEPPDDPDDPNGGDVIVIETPYGRRIMRIKKFVMALLILGTVGGTIAGIVEAIPKSENGKRKRAKISVDPGNPSTGKAPSVKITSPTRFEELYMYKKLPPNVAPPRVVSDTKGASHLGITQTAIDLGIEDQVNDYNAAAEKYNTALFNGDLDAASEYKTKMDELYAPIKDAYELVDRPDDSFQMPDPGTGFEYSRAPIDPITAGIIPGQSEALKNDLINAARLSAGIEEIEITDAHKSQGHADVIELANRYIRSYNAALAAGNHTDMIQWKSKLDGLNRWTKALRYKPPERRSEFDIKGAENTGVELDTALKELEYAKQQNAPMSTIKRMQLNIQRIREHYVTQKIKTSQVASYESYLPDEHVRKEVFPKTPEQSLLFNKLQRLEHFLVTHVNPNDRENQARKGYDAYIASIQGNQITGPNTDPTKWYRARMDVIRSQLLKYKIDPSVMDEFDKEETDINIDQTGDDPDTRVNIAGAGVVEQETKNDIADFERPNKTIGGEANFLVSSPSEIEEENKLWREYSFVKPGHGLGTVQNNGLLRHNLDTHYKRYAPLKVPQKTHQHPPHPIAKPSRMTQGMDTYQINDGFQPDNYHGNELFGFTDERLKSTEWSEYENNYNGYMPDHVLSRYKAKGTRIQQFRSDGQRFASHSYSYGEAMKPEMGGGVTDEHVPFDNAKGFPNHHPKDSYTYENATRDPYVYEIARRTHSH